MIFVEHAPFNQNSIRDNLGAPDYSYLFIRNAFRDVLDGLGKRVDVETPERDVDEVFNAAKARGEDCVFLSYHPPQRTPLGLDCPTVPVFAWEYDTIPSENWDDNPRNDWRSVFASTGRAISLSRLAAQAVRDSMGAEFPVWPIPCPLFDRFARNATPAKGWREPFDLNLEGGLALDCASIDLGAFHPGASANTASHALRVLGQAAAKPDRPAQTLRLEGVVYTAVLCPADGRKNWRDLVGAFVWAFRHTPKATLLFKLTHANVEDGLLPVLNHIATLGPFECRVVLINGLLSNAAYAELIDATSYTVNTALAEGQCLPLTEYMSAGRPAVAPSHSAMLDYVTPENSFVVHSERRIACWPQDERRAKRAHDHLTSFTDLVKQYRDSYLVARDEPARYARMSQSATDTMRAFCSEDVVSGQLQQMMQHVRQGKAS